MSSSIETSISTQISSASTFTITNKHDYDYDYDWDIESWIDKLFNTTKIVGNIDVASNIIMFKYINWYQL